MTIPPSPVAVLVAVVSTFLIGGLWYSPLLFAKRWQREVGLSDAQVNTGASKVFGVAIVAAAVFCANLGFFIGGKTTLQFGLFAGFATGLGFVGAGLVTSYVFARRSATLMVIDAGYHVVASTVAGAIFGLFGGGA